MPYSSLYKYNLNREKIPTSLNDPNNLLSYGFYNKENFIPFNFGGNSRTKAAQQQNDQQAVQQQIIQIHKQLELQQQAQTELNNIRKLQLLQKLTHENRFQSNNKIDILKNIQKDIQKLNNIIKISGNNNY